MTTESLKFVLSWLPSSTGAPRATTATLSVQIGRRAIWPVDGAGEVGLEIQVDDLLSHLTEVWKPLILRQTYPATIQPDRPSLLRAEAERRWASTSEETAEREDALVTAFEEVHDFSRCFAGLFDLPPLWLFRQGERMLVETRSALRSVGFDDARSALRAVGEEIASHLKAADAERWSGLISAWQKRNQGDPTLLLAWATSLDRDIAQSFATEGVLATPHSVAEAANDNDELRIAARMASALPEEQIRGIIALVGSFAKREAPLLDELGVRVRAYIAESFAKRRPFEQGEAAADFVRAHLKLNMHDLVDVVSAVETLGATLYMQSIEPESLLALAAWGPRHGPAVFLNELAINSPVEVGTNWLARGTLAHELCHLLLDHEHTLTAVEVLHSRMPPDIERRAKAFAGQFLLPSASATEIWKKANGPRSQKLLTELILELCHQFGVTKSVAAWKLDHGLSRNGIDLGVLLDAVAPNR
jgi:Zn-dependent peptidase ImmA (M78 family)